MKRRTRLGVTLAGAASSSAGVATGKPPIRLHGDLAVDPKKENKFSKYFDRVFRPVARKHQGFVDLKLLKLNTAVRGGVPSGGTFRFECAEQRQKWVASEDHAKAWPPMENMLTWKGRSVYEKAFFRFSTLSGVGVRFRLRARFHRDDDHHHHNQFRFSPTRARPLGDRGGESG